jgi:hypothetical protein
VVQRTVSVVADALMAEAVTLKFIPAPLTAAQVTELVQIVK